MIKKELNIDDYIKEIKNNKLEITINSSSNKNIQETLNVAGSKEKEDKTNYYLELTYSGKKTKLKQLIINKKNIIEINPNIFPNLTFLESLDLGHNTIGKIPKKIIELQSLKILNLNDNFISVLPPFLKDMKCLEELNLSNNKIELIPTSIQNFHKLKTLNISQNIIERLPMEIGLISKLESLSIEKNDFTEIPTTLCYLDNLKYLTLEWFEFLDPELKKDQDNPKVLKTLKSFLENKLMNSNMYIDFNSFVIKMSENIQKKLDEEKFDKDNLEKESGFNFNLKDIFYAFNNDYFGVIKSFINDNKDLVRAMDKESKKNLLYLSIHQNKKKVYDFLLSQVDFNSLTNNFSIIFRAIRSRNYELLLKLAKLGFPLNAEDLKGNNLYHVLFSVFNKSHEQCVQIGNFLIENNVPGYNSLNQDGWAPIHIAAKYSHYICFEWIGYINKILASQNRELFDINLLGKNNYTAFHLTCSAYKYNECITLLNLGSNLLLRTSDGKKAKNTTYNFFLTKLLYKKEQELFYNKYIKYPLKKNSNSNKNGLYLSKPFYQNNLFTFDNYYDVKYGNNITFINSERSKPEIICNKEKYSLLEKYHILMTIELSNDIREIILLLKEVLKDFLIDIKRSKIKNNNNNSNSNSNNANNNNNSNNRNNYNSNHIIICDLLNLIKSYNLYELLYNMNEIKNNLDKKNIFLNREINEVILFLEKNKGKKINMRPRRILGADDLNSINHKYNNSFYELKKKSNGNKYWNDTHINNYLLNSNEINRLSNHELKKKFNVPGFQKLKEKKVQESITSIDFEE